jgi:hypothetical protein
MRVESAASPVSQQVSAQRVAVIDLTKPSSEDPVGMAPGFHRIPDRLFARAHGKAIKADLDRVLQPIGDGAPLDIWIVDAGFYWVKTGADFIPIVNTVGFGTSGRLRCDASVSVKRERGAEKSTLDYVVTKIDTEGLQRGELLWTKAVRECYSNLIDKIARFVSGA